MEYRFIESSPYTKDDLKRLRMQNDMTQKEMAEYLGVSKKAVEAWEYGENPPSGPVKRLLDILQYGEPGALPFSVTKEKDTAVRFVVNAATHSRGNGKHWMRYLRKLYKEEKLNLTNEQIESILKSEKLDIFQIQSLLFLN